MKQIRYLRAAILFLFPIGCGSEPGTPTHGTENARDGVEMTTAAFQLALDVSSARRDPARDWTEYLDVHERKVAEATRRGVQAADATQAPETVSAKRVAVADADFTNVPVWSDVAIKAQFKATRDSRFMFTSGNSSFARRSSWLYPDDGVSLGPSSQPAWRATRARRRRTNSSPLGT